MFEGLDVWFLSLWTYLTQRCKFRCPRCILLIHRRDIMGINMNSGYSVFRPPAGQCAKASAALPPPVSVKGGAPIKLECATAPGGTGDDRRRFKSSACWLARGQLGPMHASRFATTQTPNNAMQKLAFLLFWAPLASWRILSKKFHRAQSVATLINSNCNTRN